MSNTAGNGERNRCGGKRKGRVLRKVGRLLLTYVQRIMYFLNKFCSKFCVLISESLLPNFV